LQSALLLQVVKQPLAPQAKGWHAEMMEPSQRPTPLQAGDSNTPPSQLAWPQVTVFAA
jgi:hypothetical protein